MTQDSGICHSEFVSRRNEESDYQSTNQKFDEPGDSSPDESGFRMTRIHRFVTARNEAVSAFKSSEIASFWGSLLVKECEIASPDESGFRMTQDSGICHSEFVSRRNEESDYQSTNPKFNERGDSSPDESGFRMTRIHGIVTARNEAVSAFKSSEILRFGVVC